MKIHQSHLIKPWPPPDERKVEGLKIVKKVKIGYSDLKGKWLVFEANVKEREKMKDVLGSQPTYKVRVEKDVSITMPDGVRLFADIYRPDAEGKFLGLLSFSNYGKEINRWAIHE